LTKKSLANSSVKNCISHQIFVYAIFKELSHRPRIRGVVGESVFVNRLSCDLKVRRRSATRNYAVASREARDGGRA